MPLNLPPPKSTSSVPNGTTTQLAGLSRQGDLNGDNGHSSISEQSPSTHFDTPFPGSSNATATPSSSSFTSKLGLPPPKTKSKQAASNQPKKFVLDLPKATRSASELDNGSDSPNETDGPVAKKARTAGGGLSALLPQPKKPAAGLGGLRLPEPKTVAIAPESSKPATNMVPHTLKGKTKAAPKPVPAFEEVPLSTAQSEDAEEEEEADSAVLDFFGLGPAAAEEDDEEEEEKDDSPVDFFGLSTASSSTVPSTKQVSSNPATRSLAPKASALSSFAASSIASSSVKKVSAAPTTAAPDLASNFYATLPVPTKTDPYPGFYQKPDGNWAPKRPDEWEIWSNAQRWNEDAEAAQAEAEQQKKEKKFKMPADFSETAAEQSVEVRAANLRGPQNKDLPTPSRFAEEEQKRIEEDQAKAKAKKFSHNARSRHQLTTLVADAQMNRVQLEDRISQMKSNKRTGGQKYGF